ncbi:hypothetical protein MTR_1g031920 [Medicago truncatula]|uniref:Uncharacterized protein n=1 Tax=Medicago truncatula TaxID=3880 RepID=G8A019_MEDTR|nr:hypothetical protein MTR_1g031920 [Medicago truncatula]
MRKPNLFRVRNDFTLYGLKDQLDQINCRLNHKDTRRVDSDEYRRPSTGSNGSIQFTHTKLRNEKDVGTMFSIFGQYNTKGPIELEISLVRSFEDI